MKTGIISLFFITLLAFSLQAESYPPEGWTSDVLEAIRESEETGKDILLNFTGSDWCVWCQRLEAEVFGTKEFKAYAEENLVLLFLDFPNGIKQTEEQKKQNEVMAGLFGVRGFPTIWVMDSKQLPILKTGYRDGGVEAYIEHLENDRPEIDQATQDSFITTVRQTVRSQIGEW